jgi:PAS domain S-box-containing protein
MAIQNQRLKTALFRVLPVLAALVLLLVSLVLVSDVQRAGSGANRSYLWVLVLTLVALAVLALSIVSRVASLLRKVRKEEPGARLAARWVRNFLVFSLPPALIVYGFSVYFLTQTIDNWFDVGVEDALQDSLALGQAFLDERTLAARNQVQELADGLPPDPTASEARSYLLSAVAASGPRELSLLSRSGNALTTAAYDPLAPSQGLPEDYALLQALERGEYAAAEPAGTGGLAVRVLQRLSSRVPGEERLLQAVYPLPNNLTELTDSIEAEYFQYRNVVFLRDSLKQSFILILTLVLLLTVLLAILAAISAARRMVDPLSDLALATRRVAEGELAQAVASSGDDEIGFLSTSFNDMSRALVSASEAAERSRAQLQAQGDYLETVLGSLSAGVLTLDAGGTVVRVNPAAERILGLEPGAAQDCSLTRLAESHEFLAPFVQSIDRHRVRDHQGWQQELRLEREDGNLVLLTRGSALPGSEFQASGHVVVFDDVTVLNRAQRDAAWGEVARRLAHEVKNPLTPIRLAAERLRMKLTDKLAPADADMLDRSATTIVGQVEALRRLVDAFGDYAREPDMDRQEVALDDLVREVAHLHRESDPEGRLQLELCAGPEGLTADPGQLRQLLNNLLGNAREAARGAPGGNAADITVRTEVEEARGASWLVLEVVDRGPGFPADVLERPFEPYVTHKAGGTGLGLAISRKIVLDHDGAIEISNTEAGGARVRVHLPLKRTAPRHTSLDAPGKTG